MARSVDILTTPAAEAPLAGRYAPTRNFTITSTEGEGIQLDSLRSMSRLIVHTRHSSYRLVVLAPWPWVIVQGGRHFPQASEALFRGTCLEGKSSSPSWLLARTADGAVGLPRPGGHVADLCDRSGARFAERAL